jgi:acetyl esterase/lipase
MVKPVGADDETVDPFTGPDSMPETYEESALEAPLDGCPDVATLGVEPFATVTYKTFDDPDTPVVVEEIPLKADIFIPQPFSPPAGGYPAMVLVHGGSWVGGCRTALDDVAADIANHATYPFIVASIDYRLACQKGDYPGSQVDELCGWNFSDADEPRAAMHDVQWAISYTRDEAGKFGVPFSGKVVSVGGSAGGNLVYEAAGWGPDPGWEPPGGYRTPLAVAGWSGTTQQLKYKYSPHQNVYVCNVHGEPYRTDCINGRKKYLGCPYMNPNAIICNIEQPGGTAYDASPYWKYNNRLNPEDLPPVFIANAPNEVQYFQQAFEFDQLLQLRQIDHELCVVNDRPLQHSAQYVRTEGHCGIGTSEADEVLNRTLSFLYDYVGP